MAEVKLTIPECPIAFARTAIQFAKSTDQEIDELLIRFIMEDDSDPTNSYTLYKFFEERRR